MNRTAPRRVNRIAFAALTATITLAALLTPTAAMADEPTLPAADGLTELTAAASCWEIKQNDSDADDGVYWLLTPAMTQAEQFYCDQTRNGGGWVLVGRGREGWATATAGSGTPRRCAARSQELAHSPHASCPEKSSISSMTTSPSTT